MSHGLDPETVALLAELSTSGTDTTVWTELWNELYHQYDSSVACAALPELAAIAGAGTSHDRFEAVSLAGALLAAADPYTAEIRERYVDDIAALRTEVLSELAESSPEEDHEPDTFLYRVQAMLAFEDATAWSLRLAELLEEQFEIECPICWAAMTLHLDGPGFFTCTSGFPLDTVTKRPVAAADPDQLTGLGDRLYRTAGAGRQRVIARQLTFLFGRATCTEGDHEFIPAAAVEKAAWSSSVPDF
ncbi:hypothetical protein [Nocardia sp. NBC_01329]|uniref:hypothetical protein n=1 Tax=Nocardia sp. NBC_01329 TaxID=2903594 RepID=UPI002E16604E|nr:hypothetical protein OG405_13245 [Nocardia sp. NBC_01329]